MTGKKIEAKELRCKERKPLQELIPLTAPFVVYIDPTNFCNFKCRFCPTGDDRLLREVGRKKTMMSLNLFDKIISDLKQFGQKFNLINLYKDGEPLLNKHFPKMIKKIKDAQIAERIWTKTNGSLLHPKLNRQIISAGLDMICISIEATDASGYKDFAGVDIKYLEFLENIKDLYQHRNNCDVYIKIIDADLSAGQKEKFYTDFQPISTYISIEKLMGWSNSGLKDFTLGTNPDTYDGLPFTRKEVCAYPFYVMAVNSDGSVSLCGNDWSQQTIIGTVKEKSLVEIWQSDELLQFQMMMLNRQRKKNKACGHCYYLKIVPDNLDPFIDRIKKRLVLNRK